MCSEVACGSDARRASIDMQSMIARYVTFGDVNEDSEVFASGESEVVRSTVKLHDVQ